MRRSLIPVVFIACLIFSTPVFTSASTDYEWIIQSGDRYDYSWTVENSMKTIVFQKNFYIIIDDLAEIPSDITPSAVWSLSDTGFNASFFWSNGTAFDVSEVAQPFGFNLLPVGNWSQLIDAFPIDAGFLNDDTIFGYEYYDLVAGDGIHNNVRFQKSNGVLELWHKHDFVDNVAVLRLDIELLSSTPVTVTTTSSSTTPTNPTTTIPTSGTLDPTMNLIIMAAGGSVAVLVILIVVLKRRV